MISLGALLLFQRFEGTRKFAAAALKGSARRLRPITSGKARLAAMVCGIILTVLLVLPVATLALVSFARDGIWTTQTLPPAYTLDNYTRILTEQNSSEVFLNSLSMAGIASAAALLWKFRGRKPRNREDSQWPATFAFLAGNRALGLAGNGGGHFNRGSVRQTWLAAWSLYSGGHVLDTAGDLLSALHAARRSRGAGEHGTTRSRTQRGGRKFGSEVVAKIFSRYLAPRLAGSYSGYPVGICHSFGGVCRIGAGIRSH